MEGIYTRDTTLDRASVNAEARTVTLAFSSESPVERSFGTEILDHSQQSVKLSRMESGAAVLVNHDANDQVGVVESAWIDSDRVGRATVRFGKSARASEIFQDIQDGIRTQVSVGYRVDKFDFNEQSREARAIDWTPMEISIVSIAADPSVGVGRSDAPIDPTFDMEAKMATHENIEIEVTPHETERNQPAFDADKERQKIMSAETKRRRAIDEMAEDLSMVELGREAVSEGWDVETFYKRALEKVGERNNSARAETGHDGEVDLSRKEREQFSMIRLMDAISNPNDRAAQKRAAFELEVSAEAQRGFGSDFNCRGEFVPQSLLAGQRDLSAGTATDGAELVASNLLPGSYIEVLRNTSAAMRAGATMLPGLVGNVEIPRQTSAAASTWISAEDGDATESEPQFDQVTLSPKDLACYTEVTRRLLQQSTPAIESIVRNDLAVAQALGIDLAALYGSGASGQPTGIANQTGINTLDLAAADPTYAEIVRMITLVMEDNALGGTPMFILEANGWEALSTTPKQGSGVEGNFILGDNDRVKGYPYIMSNQVTDEHYFFGDFSQLLVGEWGGLEINVDPYTHSLKGKIRYVTFKTVDVAVRQPTAFCHAHDGIV